MHLSPAYPLRTERLLIRPIDPATDVDALHAYQSLPDVCRYVPYEPRTREAVAARLADPAATRTELTEPGQYLDLAVTLPATGPAGETLIGEVLLFWHSAEHRGGEIGYVLHPAHQGRGYVTEAARLMLRLAFDDLGLHRVVARIDERNRPSAAVLERLGMRREAVLVENEWFKGEWSTEVVYAMLDREWRALQDG